LAGEYSFLCKHVDWEWQNWRNWQALTANDVLNDLRLGSLEKIDHGVGLKSSLWLWVQIKKEHTA
jgi:hypothetical protein